MKTFEQLLQEIEPYPFRQHGKPLYTFEQFQEANRKWLTQKRQELKESYNGKGEFRFAMHIHWIDELLEELSVPNKESRSEK